MNPLFAFDDDARTEALGTLWSRGKCYRHSLNEVAWKCGEDGKINLGGHRVSCAELTEMAVMVCQTCPVQYDCARYAVTYEEAWGVWSMRRRHLEWLQNVGVKVAERLQPGEALAIIATAEASGTPVEQAVATARAARRAVVSSPA